MSVYRFVSPLLVLPAALLGQPQARLIWSFEGNDGIYNTMAGPDVNLDSTPDVFGIIYYSATPSDPRKVYCLSGATGETLWVNRTAYGTWGNKAFDLSPDLNRDGVSDVLIGTAGGYTTAGRSVLALSGLTGDTLWRYTKRDSWGWVYCVRSFADIDGDSVADILGAAGTTTKYSGAGVLVSGRTGQPVWFFRLPADAAECIAPFDDINGDSVPDVLLGAGGNSVNDTAYCLSGADGARIWTHDCLDMVSDIERIPDVNSSGTADCITGSWSDSVSCLEGSDGSVIWGTDIGSIVSEVVPVRDLNGDGKHDVIAGSWDSRVHVLSGSDGSVLWSGDVGADVWMVDTLADVTGDGKPEVIAGALNGRQVKLFNGVTGQALWYYPFGERVYDVTGAPDLDGDGKADVLVGLQDQSNEPNHLVCLAGMPPSGAAEAGPGSMGGPAIRVLPRRLIVNVPDGCRYRLALIDVAGRQQQCFNGTGAGRHEVPLSVAGIGSGVRFAVLALEDGTRTTAKLAIP
jgi:outer membrane protein assembly factor BamB